MYLLAICIFSWRDRNPNTTLLACGLFQLNVCVHAQTLPLYYTVRFFLEFHMFFSYCRLGLKLIPTLSPTASIPVSLHTRWVRPAKITRLTSVVSLDMCLSIPNNGETFMSKGHLRWCTWLMRKYLELIGIFITWSHPAQSFFNCGSRKEALVRSHSIYQDSSCW